MPKEKFNLMVELRKKKQELQGKKKLALIGQGDFPGANNVMRSTMNIKHQTQHITIDNPEFPFLFDGKENLINSKKIKKFLIICSPLQYFFWCFLIYISILIFKSA